ncbi:MAG: response regulator transcription factor [Flavobacteriales bacterium]
MENMRVMLVDDQSIILDGLAALLEGEPGIEVVGTAANGQDAVDTAMRLKPDVIVMDINMPIMDGIEATRLVKKKLKNVQVLILSMYNRREFITEILAAGASGYVLKNTNRKELLEAVHTVAEGHRYLADEVQGVLNPQSGPDGMDEQRAITLTKREREVITLIAQQRSSPEIADMLNLSPATVETHRKNILHKLGLHNGAGLVKYAMERGWDV